MIHFRKKTRLALSIISLLLCFGLNGIAQIRAIQAVNDTLDLYPGIPQVFDILANDSIPAGVRIKIININGAGHVNCQKVHDTAWRWTFTFSVPNWGYGGVFVGGYKFFTATMDTGSAKIIYRIHNHSFAYLNINNVNARFNAWGNHFFCDTAQYEVPKGSGKTSIFSNSFWIGGKDEQGRLHFAGERYRQGPTTLPANTQPDFYAGPVMDSVNYSVYQDTIWNYIWNLRKTEIDYHRQHYNNPGYVPVHDILTWPGNGQTSLGQAHRLAPFSDRNGNGIYEPMDGDYPEIRGDQALFFIFNDDRGPHLESMGSKLRVEIHGMAYAFDLPEDSALKNTVFLNYKLYNRSQNTYDSTLLGIFTDIDLGYANDDFTGCDVERNMYFGYNGTPVDGTGQPYAYGENPPTQSVTIMAGPYMDADQLDNPRYDIHGNPLCDFSVNGLNFGDSIIDNERYGLQRFIYCNNSNSGVPQYMTDPAYAADYYQLMTGKWKDGQPVFYGGNGHPATSGYGPACRFMFPGESDTLNWGTGCIPPFGPKNWTEETATNNPGDRRGVGITGPFTFEPGDVQDLDLAFTWARDYGAHSPLSSLAKLREMTDIVNRSFATNRLPNGNQFYGISDHQGISESCIKIYPNPAANTVNIRFSEAISHRSATLELLTLQGETLLSAYFSGNNTAADLTGIPSGFYLLRIKTEGGFFMKKLVIAK